METYLTALFRLTRGCYLCTMQPNFQRMMQLVTEFFDTADDATQISVSEAERKKLGAIDPAVFNEMSNEEGPYVWILLFPTTRELMNRFLEEKITEKQLLEQTPVGVPYQCVYLCSASVLPEFRGKGLAKQATEAAIRSIQTRHSLEALFVWSFSEGGEKLAERVSADLELPLFRRQR